MNNFELGEFINGEKVEYSFNILDTLSESDYAVVAARFAELVKFCHVVPVRESGVKLAAALKKYADPNAEMIVVVDFVINSGKAMTKAYIGALADRDRGKYKLSADVMGFALWSLAGQQPQFCNTMFQLCHEYLEQ